MLDRRGFLASAVSAGLAPSAVWAQAEGAATLPLPNPQTFQSGDLIWPKKPGAFVPYRAGAPSQFETERSLWLQERQQFLERQRTGGPAATQLSSTQVEAIQSLDFREFHARYAGDQRPGVPGTYSTGGGLYVGHVGVLEVESTGAPWVIEALWGKGVVRHSYADWLKGRPGEVVWHGRLRDIEPSARARIATEARRHVGTKYDFWNFNLLDDTSFYCSKLVWLAIMKTQGFAVDGDPEPKRGFWFSPKQLLYCKPVARLHDPGPYAN
jgi:hypothetical protein